MTRNSNNTPHHLVLTVIYFALTVLSLIVIIANSQIEPCPTGETRDYVQHTVKPLLYGMGIIAFGLSSVLTLFHALEFFSGERARQDGC